MFRRHLLVAVLLSASIVHARDRAVLVYPRERRIFRPVFYTAHQRAMQVRLGSAFDLDVHEQIATDDALFQLDIDGAKVLVLSGHGDPFAIYFSGRKDRTLDASDRERLTAFLGRLDPSATIVLQSCETGRGFAHFVKEAAGPTRNVIAARGAVPWNGMQVTSVAPFDATMRCRDGSRSWDCTLRLN